jgi:excinuclease ABC subunit C
MTIEKPHRPTLLERAKTSAQAPGVYLMKDERDAILYVGKAKNLRNRITSYFQPLTHPHPRTERIVSQVTLFDTIITETESEALIL